MSCIACVSTILHPIQLRAHPFPLYCNTNELLNMHFHDFHYYSMFRSFMDVLSWIYFHGFTFMNLLSWIYFHGFTFIIDVSYSAVGEAYMPLYNCKLRQC
jgi:hypothetical protein